MKRSKLWMGWLVACGLVAGTVWALPVPKESATLDGVTWIYTLDGGNATITGVVAPVESVLTMPSTLGGCPVTDIGYEAFAGNNNIAVMSIPDSVKDIGDSAFDGCSSLQAVDIGNNVTNIGWRAFAACPTLSAVTFGNRVKTIEAFAFESCEKLTRLNLPDSVTSIEYSAFSGCFGLASVSLGKGLETIGQFAFEKCGRLETLTIPDSVTSVGAYAFLWCDGLTNMVIPNSVTYLGKGAFIECQYLQSVVLPDNLTSLGDNLFSNCYSLASVNIPDTVTNIGSAAFLSCERLQSLTIPAGVTAVGENAFAGCRSLATLHVPTSLRGALGNAGIPAGCTLDFYVNQQTAIFNANGGNCAMQRRIYELGVPYAELPEATRDHHVFAGWWTEATGGERVLESDIVQAVEFRTIYAHWTLTEQVVTFKPNGGLCDTGTNAYAVGGTYGSLPVPTREHHVFAGWWTEADGGDRVTTGSPVSETEYRTLYAHWTLVEQVVSFVDYAGHFPGTNLTYAVGQPYFPLPVATIEHYVADWYTDRWDGELVTESTIVPSNEYQTLYARWRRVEQVVTFDPNGGACGTETQIQTIGQPYANLPAATLEHYSLAGWFTERDGGDRVDGTIVPATDTRTLYAHWTLVEHVVTFDPNGGTCPETNRTYTVGQPYASFPTPTLEHYAADWYTAPTGGEPITPDTIVPAVEYLTLYAQWTRVDQIVTFDPNGGSCDTETQIQTIGQPYANLPAATLEHYALAGWFTERDGGDRVDGTLVPATDTRTLYAHWTRAEQVVSFECENGTCDMSNRAYAIGGTYSPLPAVTFDNPQVAFVGWFTSDGVGISEDTVVAPKESLSLYARGMFLVKEKRDRWIAGVPIGTENSSSVFRAKRASGMPCSARARSGKAHSGTSWRAFGQRAMAKWS